MLPLSWRQTEKTSVKEDLDLERGKFDFWPIFLVFSFIHLFLRRVQRLVSVMVVGQTQTSRHVIPCDPVRSRGIMRGSSAPSWGHPERGRHRGSWIWIVMGYADNADRLSENMVEGRNGTIMLGSGNRCSSRIRGQIHIHLASRSPLWERQNVHLSLFSLAQSIFCRPNGNRRTVSVSNSPVWHFGKLNSLGNTCMCTEPRKSLCTWLRDICSWPCLVFLPGCSLARFANFFPSHACMHDQLCQQETASIKLLFYHHTQEIVWGTEICSHSKRRRGHIWEWTRCSSITGCNELAGRWVSLAPPLCLSVWSFRCTVIRVWDRKCVASTHLNLVFSVDFVPHTIAY